MKTNATPPNSSSRQASRFTRPGLAGRHGVSVLAPVHAATFLLILISASLLTPESEAASVPVYNTNDRLAGSLRQAIQDANPQGGDTIIFQIPTSDPGYDAATRVFTVTLTTAELVISKNLTITGGGQKIAVHRSTIPGTPTFRIFHAQADNVVLSGLTISNGDASNVSQSPSGGGVRNAGLGHLTVLNCTFSGNDGSGEGGGIANRAGTLTVDGCTFCRNNALLGGGLYNSSPGSATVTRSTFSDNTSGGLNGGKGGGIYNGGTTLTLTSCTITGNAAPDAGGGVYTSFYAPHVRNTIIAGNSTTDGSGRDLRGSFISDGYNFIGVIDNQASGFGNAGSRDQAGTTAAPATPGLGPLQDNGGPTQTNAPVCGSFVIDQGDSAGLETDQRGFPRKLDDSRIFNAGDGTDIGACEAAIAVDRVEVKNNDDSGAGSLRRAIADVCAGSTITFAPNVRGAINLTSGELLIDKNLTISGPGANLLSVQRSAAAGTPDFRIFHFTATASIDGLRIANGRTPGDGSGTNNGAGISSSSTLTVTNCIISGNNSGGSGGGILGTHTLTIRNSTISGNTATEGFGGGIYNTGSLSITNSTISGNSASDSGFGIGLGGGIQNTGGTVTVTNSTISANTAQFRGGGISNNTTGTVRARNTIIALNISASGPDVYGTLTSEGFNLIGNRVDATIANESFSDLIGPPGSTIDPLLGPLQDNGGPSWTHALLSGSVAIDTGNSSGSSTDQRGFARPVDNPAITNASGGDGGDVGAFEFGGAAGSLEILSITRSGNGPVVLQVAGFPYGVHRIQASADMRAGSFLDLATVTADAAGRFQYQGPVAGPKKFYRVAFP